MTENASLEVGIVGLGRMGLRHLEAVQQLGMRVVGLADPSPAALEAARQAAPEAETFATGEEMLDRLRPAAAVIATTAPYHAPLVLAAAASGARHILCEKPLASSLAQADEMIAACAAAGARLAVNHQMRFMPNYSEVKALIGSESLGPLTSMIVAGSNFGLAMNASHYFEAFRYLTGAEVSGIQAWLERDTLPNPRGAEFEDRSGRLLAWGKSGAALYIDFSAEAGWGLQVVYVCRYGQIFVDELNGEIRIAAREAEYRDLPTSRYGMPASIEQARIAPADTVAPTVAVWRAMLAGEAWPDGAAGRHALACLVAAHASHRRGGTAVSLDAPDLPRDEIFPWA